VKFYEHCLPLGWTLSRKPALPITMVATIQVLEWVPTVRRLQKTTKYERIRLAQALWSWTDVCGAEQTCRRRFCPCWRLGYLDPYFQYYEQQCNSYEDATTESYNQRTLQSHDDICNLIEQVKRVDSSLTKVALLKHLRADKPESEAESEPSSDEESAIDLVIRVSTMINTSSGEQESSALEHGFGRLSWRSSLSYHAFLAKLFPVSDHSSQVSNKNSPESIFSQVKAKRMKRELGLKFQPTNDLSRHLKIDYHLNVLEIFHHTAFLKEHLRHTKNTPQPATATLTLEELKV
jgi:hypothetical protein